MAFWCVQATLADSFLADLEDLSDDENHDEVIFFKGFLLQRFRLSHNSCEEKYCMGVLCQVVFCNVLDISAYVYNYSAVTHCPLNMHIHKFCVDDSLSICFTNLERELKSFSVFIFH